MIHDLETYADLLKVLESLTPEQLAQPIQFIPPSPIEEESGVLGKVIAVGTVGEMFSTYGTTHDIGIVTRSSYDNGHHPEDLVFLLDGNPFAEDGSIAVDLLTGERIFPKGEQ